MIKIVLFFALLAMAYAAPQYLINSLVPSPLAYNVPAPYAYSTGNLISYAAEPVEQHGYRIAY